MLNFGRDAVYPALLPVFRALRALSNKFDKAVLARWIKLLESSSWQWRRMLLHPIRAFAFNLPVLHGYAIYPVRPAEIRHFARLPQRQRADYGQQPD